MNAYQKIKNDVATIKKVAKEILGIDISTARANMVASSSRPATSKRGHITEEEARTALKTWQDKGLPLNQRNLSPLEILEKSVHEGIYDKGRVDFGTLHGLRGENLVLFFTREDFKNAAHWKKFILKLSKERGQKFNPEDDRVELIIKIKDIRKISTSIFGE